ncbi:methyltransferase domain-containing protein [Streptomyces acidicola]|uniref:methyltransferase domain-containing protein n=1 Tax=Streptomyces acidicola TaxID=2596892 RepID=UPI00342567B1
MIKSAVRFCRTPVAPHHTIREGDAHALPVDPGTVDRAKIDRVLMHVAEPSSVLVQLHLAARPGARIALAEPDWDTLVVDAEDLGTSRAFTRYTTSEVVRHATIGRSYDLAQLRPLADYVKELERDLTAARTGLRQMIRDENR